MLGFEPLCKGFWVGKRNIKGITIITFTVFKPLLCCTKKQHPEGKNYKKKKLKGKLFLPLLD